MNDNAGDFSHLKSSFHALREYIELRKEEKDAEQFARSDASALIYTRPLSQNVTNIATNEFEAKVIKHLIASFVSIMGDINEKADQIILDNFVWLFIYAIHNNDIFNVYDLGFLKNLWKQELSELEQFKAKSLHRNTVIERNFDFVMESAEKTLIQHTELYFQPPEFLETLNVVIINGCNFRQDWPALCHFSETESLGFTLLRDSNMDRSFHYLLKY